jgi:hypothetical protein
MKEATIKQLAQVVSTGVDIWKDDKVPKQMTLRSPNFETISAVAICRLLRIRNLLKLVSKRPGLCQQLEEMKSSAPFMLSAGLFCSEN